MTERRSENLEGQKLNILIDEQPPYNIMGPGGESKRPRTQTASGDKLEIYEPREIGGIFFKILGDMRLKLYLMEILERRKLF